MSTWDKINLTAALLGIVALLMDDSAAYGRNKFNDVLAGILFLCVTLNLAWVLSKIWNA